MSQRYSKEEVLGFGPISERLILVEVPADVGSAFPYSPTSISYDKPDSVAEVNHCGILPLNKNNKDIYFAFPHLPAGAHLSYTPPAAEEQVGTGVSDEVLRAGGGKVVMKVAVDSVESQQLSKNPPEIGCIESGRRSAISTAFMEDEPSSPSKSLLRCYRLKGCGDLGEGFHCIPASKDFGPIASKRIKEIQEGEEGQSSDSAGAKKVITVRGTGWLQTTLRELHVNDQVSRLMTQKGSVWERSFQNSGASSEPPTGLSHPTYEASMESVGFWTYQGAIPHLLEGRSVTLDTLRELSSSSSRSDSVCNPLALETENIVPVVGVFKANGERRLESHLLRGFERLLKKEVAENLTTLRNLSRDIFLHTSVVPETRRDGSSIGHLLSETAMQFFMRPDLLELQGAVDNPTNENFAQLERMLAISKERGSSEGLTTTIERRLLVMYSLADRAGFETGVVMRAMHTANLSWGTYDDALGTHCNGHSNNMMVLRSFLLPSTHQEGSSSSSYCQLVAPLDFDMAYFLWEKDDPIEKKKLDPKGAEYLAMERNSMALCLGRMEGANSGCESMESLEFAEYEKEISELLQNMVTILRDTVAVGFTEGLRGVRREVNPKFSLRCELLDQQERELARNIVAQALEATRDVIA